MRGTKHKSERDQPYKGSLLENEATARALEAEAGGWPHFGAGELLGAADAGVSVLGGALQQFARAMQDRLGVARVDSVGVGDRTAQR
jgi:hypothetical protein